MLDLKQLEQLVAIAEAGSLSAAAEQLHLSQPALSRSMQRLEADLGVTLFERSRNRIVLRELGEHAVENAKDLLREAGRFTEDLREHAARLSVIWVGATSLAPLWRLSIALHELYPGRVVAEEQHDAPVLSAGLREGRYQLILTHEPLDEAGVLCGKFLEERLMLEIPSTHALASRGSLDERDLSGLTVLSYRHIGFWRDRIRSVQGLHLIEQAEPEVLEDLVLSSGLPVLVSSLHPSPITASGGHVRLPIRIDSLTEPIYLCARKADRELFESLC